MCESVQQTPQQVAFFHFHLVSRQDLPDRDRCRVSHFSRGSRRTRRTDREGPASSQEGGALPHGCYPKGAGHIQANAKPGPGGTQGQSVLARTYCSTGRRSNAATQLMASEFELVTGHWPAVTSAPRSP
jgi:hypothetical protein